jgi:hypothetical protein
MSGRLQSGLVKLIIYSNISTASADFGYVAAVLTATSLLTEPY